MCEISSNYKHLTKNCKHLTRNNIRSLRRTFVSVPDSHNKAVQNALSNMILDIQEGNINKEGMVDLLNDLHAVTGFPLEEYSKEYLKLMAKKIGESIPEYEKYLDKFSNDRQPLLFTGWLDKNVKGIAF